MMNFDKIDNNIKTLSFLISHIGEDDISTKLVTECISVFNQLFNDGLTSKNSIQAQIKRLVDTHTPEDAQKAWALNYQYVDRVATLKGLIDLLPDDFSYKNRLNSRLLDNCPNEWIEQYKQGLFTQSKENFDAFIESQKTVDWSNTVEVKTWGTREELGNGLKNVLRQKIQGEAIGHSALVMRIPVNEANRRLIDKYCLHKNGSLKIPHQIKNYGNQPIYEIYWSYWPDRLNKMGDDIEEERSGFKFTTKSDILNKLPPELKERYVFQKQRKDIFDKTHTIDLAPIVTLINRPEKYDEKRDKYLILKAEKYKLEEEINALHIMKNNYLDSKKEYSAKNEWDKNIHHESNFLILIDRFKKQFPYSKRYETILKNKKIRWQDAVKLHDDINELIEKKRKDLFQLDNQISIATKKTSFIFSKQLSDLKKERKQLHEEINLLNHLQADYLSNDKEFSTKSGWDNKPIKTHSNFLSLLARFKNQFTDRKKYARILKDKRIFAQDAVTLIEDTNNLISKKEYEVEQLKKQIEHTIETIYTPAIEIKHIKNQIKIIQNELKNNNNSNQIQLQQQLKALRDDLEELYSHPKEKTIEIYKKRMEKNSELITEAEEKLLELETLLRKEEENKNTVVFNGDNALISLQKLLESKYPIDFIYKIHRDKTEKEIEVYGNQVIADEDVWEIKNKQDAEALVSIMLKEQIRLKRTLKNPNTLLSSIDFVYNNNRDKTEDEIEAYGNLRYKNGDDIWTITNKKDIEILMSIIDQDIRIAKDSSDSFSSNEEKIDFITQAHEKINDLKNIINTLDENKKTAFLNGYSALKSLKKTIEVDGVVDFIYNNGRNKTAEEIERYENDFSIKNNDVIWKIKSNEDAVNLMNIIKCDQEKIKNNPGGILSDLIDFEYSNRDKTIDEIEKYGNNIYTESNNNVWELKSIKDGDDLISIIKMDIQKLKTDITLFSNTILDIQLQSHVLSEQLKNKHIIRGAPVSSVILKGFNIKHMLKQASNLATTTSNFNVVTENCSTTSMKLLNTGSPREMQHMFKWTTNTTKNPAINAFLTNPQSIYSASSLVSQAQNGDKKSKDIIKKEAYLHPNTAYYMQLNKLLAFKDNKAGMLAEIKKNKLNYLTMLPHFIRDLWINEDSHKTHTNERGVDAFLTELDTTIKALNYKLISHKNPIIAIDEMIHELNADLIKLPFFDEKTLHHVKTFILDLESKESLSNTEQDYLVNYYKTITERDERVRCVEEAVYQKKNVVDNLLSRINHSTTLLWPITPETQTTKKITEQFKKHMDNKPKQNNSESKSSLNNYFFLSKVISALLTLSLATQAMVVLVMWALDKTAYKKTHAALFK